MARKQKRLHRLLEAKNRTLANTDYMLVWAQVKQYKPPVPFPEEDTAEAITQATRRLIEWARANQIEIELPEGWS